MLKKTYKTLLSQTNHSRLFNPSVLSLSFNFLKDFFFAMDQFWCFFKSLLNVSQYCFCSMVWLFGREAHGTLAPHAGVEPTPCPGRRTAREASQMFSDVLKHKSCLTPPA